MIRKSKKATINKVIAALFAVALLVGIGSPVEAAENRIGLILNGEYVKWNEAVYGKIQLLDVPGGGRNVIPLRIISEKLGYEVTWNQETKTANVFVNHQTSQDILPLGYLYKFPIGQKKIEKYWRYPDGVEEFVEAYALDVANTAIAGRTYLPMRAFFETVKDDENRGNIVSWKMADEVVRGHGVKLTELQHDNFVVARKETHEEAVAQMKKGRSKLSILASEDRTELLEELTRIARTYVPRGTEIDYPGGFKIGTSGAGNIHQSWLSVENLGSEIIVTVRSWQKQGVPEVTRDILLLIAGQEDGMEIYNEFKEFGDKNVPPKSWEIWTKASKGTYYKTQYNSISGVEIVINYKMSASE